MYNPEKDDRKSLAWNIENVGSLTPAFSISKPFQKAGFKRPQEIVLTVSFPAVVQKRKTTKQIHGRGQTGQAALSDLIAGLKFNNVSGSLNLATLKDSKLL